MLPHPLITSTPARRYSVTDFLDQKRAEITRRLNELRPLVDEYHQLEAASSALQGVKGTGSNAAATRRRGPGRPRGSRTTTTARRRPRARPRAPTAKKTYTRTCCHPDDRATRRPPPRQTQGQRRPCSADARAREGSAERHHDPRARFEDGHQAELPLPRAAGIAEGRQGSQARPQLVPARRLAPAPSSPLGRRHGPAARVPLR